MNMSFTERDAIHFEMEELKEQARRDFEIYLTSRNMRAERYTQLMERLREIDERTIRNKSSIQTPQKQVFEQRKQEATLVRDLPKPKFEGTLQDLRIDKVRPNQEIIVKSEPEKEEFIENGRNGKKFNKRPKGNIKIEDVDPVVEKYLRFRQTEERTKDIQTYVEKELGAKWTNFSAIMGRILELNPRIKKAERHGFYYYESV